MTATNSNEQDWKTFLIITANVLSSVSLILVNKVVMKTCDFQFVLFLTLSHFAVTAVMLELCNFLRLFESKRLPARHALFLSLLNVGSIVFMNLSLQKNSVGVYQIAKLLCIPATVLIQFTFFQTKFTLKVLSCLTVLILGVGIVTVTDVELNKFGSIYALLAIVCTSLSQIYISEGQSKFKLTPLQMLHTMLAPQAAITFFIAFPIEVLPKSSELLEKLLQINTVIWILLSCAI